MNIFTLDLKRNDIPLYKQLYNFIIREIKLGNLKENEKLPSKRALSNHLNISQNTIETAYEMLSMEGYIKSVPRSGFYVCKFEKLDTKDIKFFNQPIVDEKIYKYDFSTNIVDTSSFPYTTWAKITKEIMYNHPELLQHGHRQGDLCLRNSLSKYLHEFRGVNCIPEQIVIGAGMEYLISLITEILDKQSIYAFENPGYYKIYKIIKNNDRHTNIINLDNSGMDIDLLKRSNSNVVYITPSNQFPMNIVMPITRRIEILNWANKVNGFVIEDDYNSEFNFNGKPIPSLQGLDENDKVIYIGTFSRSIAPSIRVAYMVLPISLLEIYQRNFSFYSSTVSRIEQHTICKFIDDGHFSRHLNRMKNIYKKRKEILIDIIKSILLNKVQIVGENGGLHLLLKIINGFNERTLIENAKKVGIRINGLSNYYIEEQNLYDNIIVLGYSGIETEKLEQAINLLNNCFK